MPGHSLKRGRQAPRTEHKPKKRIKKFKKQTDYHSSSEDGEVDTTNFSAVNLQLPEPRQTAQSSKTIKSILKPATAQFAEDDSEDDTEIEDQAGVDDEKGAGDPLDTDDDDGSESEASTNAEGRKLKKRNDPEAFANSMSKILASKLTASKRADPVLSRSKQASTATKELNEARLEARARHKLREEKREALDRGRVRDVLGLETADTSTADILETEKKLKKTAQRGVVKLFNAVRAAQVKGEEAAKQQQKDGTVGMQKREEKVNEMSKQGFLDLIAGGGKPGRSKSSDI